MTFVLNTSILQHNAYLLLHQIYLLFRISRIRDRVYFASVDACVSECVYLLIYGSQSTQNQGLVNETADLSGSIMTWRQRVETVDGINRTESVHCKHVNS